MREWLVRILVSVPTFIFAAFLLVAGFWDCWEGSYGAAEFKLLCSIIAAVLAFLPWLDVMPVGEAPKDGVAPDPGWSAVIWIGAALVLSLAFGIAFPVAHVISGDIFFGPSRTDASGILGSMLQGGFLWFFFYAAYIAKTGFFAWAAYKILKELGEIFVPESWRRTAGGE